MTNSRGTSPSIQGSKAIELKHLRSAVAAADCGSLRQAAELLRSQQSTLSRLVSQIEHYLGVAMFERSSGGVTPTAAGRSILRLARTILEEFDALIATAKSLQNGEAGRLTIGFCTSLTAGKLKASLLDFKQRFPRIEVATVERSRTRLATALRNGVLDILIVTGSLPLPDCKTRALWSERVLVALPQEHPLTARQAIYWTDLRGETVLLSYYDPGRDFEDLLVSKLVLPEDRPRIERHDVSCGIIKSLISMKAGISLVLESDTGAIFADLVYRDVRDGTGPSRFDFSAYWCW
ncbi:LysR family transcriptional regulator [Bradyrhizobium sp. CCGUVB4N]|uniref:LysR substrate-binding domain-containing protein n=1 Tax=Bradyrhizobium sp. CCGUVB4N TaxID=2949631 RepID=UPI0020B3364D|nr:LysR family transcriptional regulator [Bradyrhizobium sp. CCGUVB4N]MCP3380282.1 LysR family transcriptional regulator [Bradyrhizobium sp. CCGUVB4N]